MKKIVKTLLVISVILIQFNIYHTKISAAAHDESITDNTLVMVSLGDSYSSGEGISPFFGSEKLGQAIHAKDRIPYIKQMVKNEDWLAHRSTKAWSSLIKIKKPETDYSLSAYKFDKNTKTDDKDFSNKYFRWYFKASSGAVTNNLNEEEQKKEVKINYNDLETVLLKSITMIDPKKPSDIMIGLKNTYDIDMETSLPKQFDIFDGINEDVDYVTISIGGNDLAFTDIIAITSCNVGSIDINMLDAMLFNKIFSVYNDTPDQKSMINKWTDVFTEIERRAPYAQIFVVGYPELYRSNGNSGCLVHEKEATKINFLAQVVDNALENLVDQLSKKGMKIHYVSVIDKFKGHQAYQKPKEDAWINPMIWGAHADDLNQSKFYSAYSMHPNEKGAIAYSERMNEEIAKYPLKSVKIKYQVKDSKSINLSDVSVEVMNMTTGEKVDLKKQNPNSGEIEIGPEKGTYSIIFTKDGYISHTMTKYLHREINDLGNIVLTEGQEDLTEQATTSQDIPQDAREYQNRHYKLYNDSISWKEAEERCESMGGHLVTIVNAEEQLFVEELLSKEATKDNYWTGGYLEPKHKIWRWVNDDPMYYVNWDNDQPDNLKNSESFIRVFSKNLTFTEWQAQFGKWNDCANEGSGDDSDVPLNTFGYICEWENEELIVNKSSEKTNSTTYRYEIFNETMNWEDAKLKCETMGGHLATITSAEEQEYINQLNSDCSRLWIGGYRNDSFTWFWVTGEKWDYENWDSGEPNNSGNVVPDENCVVLWPQRWNDLANSNTSEQRGFICEWE